jgi:hypothetical protein
VNEGKPANGRAAQGVGQAGFDPKPLTRSIRFYLHPFEIVGFIRLFRQSVPDETILRPDETIFRF